MSMRQEDDEDVVLRMLLLSQYRDGVTGNLGGADGTWPQWSRADHSDPPDWPGWERYHLWKRTATRWNKSTDVPVHRRSHGHLQRMLEVLDGFGGIP